jgi:M6 family metalloprotease-like protein
MRCSVVLVALYGIPDLARVASAQEVRFEATEQDDRFEFTRAWFSIADRVRETRRGLVAGGNFDLLNSHFDGAVASAAVAAANEVAVVGEFRVPVLVGFFADSTHQVQPSIPLLQTTLFSTAAAPPYSVRTYFDEVSAGLAQVTGDVYGWFRADSAHTWYGDSDGDGNYAYDHVEDYIINLLDQAEAAGVDFSIYDRDGDSFVDVLAVLHPLNPIQCDRSNGNFSSHRSALSYWTGSPYLTDDGVYVNDYTIQSAAGGQFGCDDTQIMAIGTFSHEMGHGFRLPDLYDRVAPGQGIGEWGLMGSGNWRFQNSPAHMMAWTKDQLGWVAIDTVVAGTGQTSRSLDPVITSSSVLRLNATGSDQYFLLENRQVLGSDQGLRTPGLLIWHIDEARFSVARNDTPPYGIALEQADGLFDLEAGTNRSDTGDPFPGSTGNTTYGATSVPDSDLNSGARSWVEIASISQEPDGSISLVLQSSSPELLFAQSPFPVAAAAVAAGDTVVGGSWAVLNDGTEATGPFSIGFFISPDSAISAADIRLGGFGSTGLAPDAEYTRPDAKWPLSADLSEGTWFVGMLIDETDIIDEFDETNNYLSARITVGEPDLLISESPFPPDAVTTAPGDTLVGSSWTVRNAGTAPAAATSNGFYISADTVITAADQLLDSNGTPALDPGEEHTVGASRWRIPSSQGAGDYFIGVLVDRSGQADESDESNNYISTRITVSDTPEGTIVLKAGPEPSADVVPGGSLAVPILADMSAADGLDLASMTFEVSWDPDRLTYSAATPGNFGTVTLNTTQTGSGLLTASISNPTGTTSDFTALNLSLTAGGTEGTTDLDLAVTVAGDESGQDITTAVSERGLSVCVGLGGFWGDVTGDDTVNIIDAQQIARYSVGLPVTDPDRFLTHGDVTADGNVNIIDAQQVARYSVGLPTPGRAGDAVGGGC